ncbi:hypothetical protein ACFV0H_06610 [Streptomyces erythrochromogenes]|uniref:hypothetical protein n=1 Tax=Streptomyces erythrochromogenes TaxID=285574 RepID=UPI00368978AA
MITGHLNALDVLVLATPGVAAVHLLLPYAFRVRPVLVARRAAVFVAVWAVTWGLAVALPRLERSFGDELGGGRSSVVGSGLFTVVAVLAVTVGIAGSAVNVVRACRRHVRLRPVAAAALPVLRDLVEAAEQSGRESDEAQWAAASLDEAQAVLRGGREIDAVWQLHTVATVLCAAGAAGAVGSGAAQVRDRLEAAGRQEGLFTDSGRDFHSVV